MERCRVWILELHTVVPARCQATRHRHSLMRPSTGRYLRELRFENLGNSLRLPPRERHFRDGLVPSPFSAYGAFMSRTTWLAPAVLLSVALAAQAQGNGNGKREANDPAGVARLVSDSGGDAQVSVNGATGAARFVRVAPGRKLGLQRSAARAASDDAKKNRSADFLSDYASVFGITSVAGEFGEARVSKDRHGGTHVTRKQVYQGLPVFGAELKAHFDAADEMVAVNGTFIPGIAVNPRPTRSSDEAGRAAVAMVRADIGRTALLSARQTTLMVFREGLAKGVDGANHLAWQVEVGNGMDVREFVYLDAHTGKFIDQISGIHEGKSRRAYDARGATAPGANYPNTPFWVEGNAFPTGTTEADNMIAASGEIYDMFKVAFGRDSFDGAGATMDSIFNRGNGCPNASWNGTFISFCPGTTTDDVTAHEWGHAYTEYTSGLIYAWQPGALNEAYSDIWGETVDRLNGRGGDTPDASRSAGMCTAYTSVTQVTVTAPAAIAGVKSTGTAAFGPQTFFVAANNVVVVNDGTATPTLGCNAGFANATAIAGKIAYMDRGSCGFEVKVRNAQANGAIGVIIGNNAAGIANMAGDALADPTIPALSVLQVDGAAIKANSGVMASMQRGPGTDSSVRWLIGEDSTAFGGAIRDMYNPTCYGNPGKVSDKQYSCGPNTPAGDNGGVHGNSGVPNHAYALMVDGGTYNGQSITALGLTKAAHIHFRAQSVYLGPASDFADHADAVEQSCADLTGKTLADLRTGAPSGEVISASDCAQVAKVALAVELRTPPSQCNFVPLLAKEPPPLCEAGGSAKSLFTDKFETGGSTADRWTVSHTAVTPDFTPRDWKVVSGLPDKRSGRALFGIDFAGGTCAPGGDESGVLHIVSPDITIPAAVTAPRVTFDHWVATEAGYDGGNLKISVNGGAWQLVKAADFVYNPYNTTLATAAQGNTNPMAGEPAFSGSDGGSVSGSWGRSIVNLAPYAKSKDKIRLRFDMGNDGCGGTFGWFVDDLMVYSCRP
jgi:Zn-dependent metalloprotease